MGRSAPMIVATAPIKESPLPDRSWTIAGYALVAIGALAGWGIQQWIHPPAFTPAPEISAFALLYVPAQAIERLLEPLSTLLDKATDKAAKVSARNDAFLAVAAASNEGVRSNSLTTARTTQKDLDKLRRNKAVVLWTAASMLAMIASGWLGIYLLKLIGVAYSGGILDIFVTGLVVGGGTKPLHDLIANIQKAKEKTEDTGL